MNPVLALPVPTLIRKLLFRWLSALTLSLLAMALAGCGGSGAGAGGGGGSGSGGGQAVPTLTLAAYPVGQTVTTNSLSLASPAELRATVRDSAGNPVPNAVVMFFGSAQLRFTPAATALTNANGVASVTITPADLNAAGAETVSAQATVSKVSVNGTWPIAIGPTNMAISSLRAILASGATTVPAYGTATLEAQVSPANVPVSIEFGSSCVAAGKATVSTPVPSNNGIALATYTDKGCGQVDTVTAKVAGSSDVRSTSLTVTAPAVANIEFVDALPQTIGLAGTGAVGLQQTSTVTFRVLDQAGNPMATQDVDFSLSTSTGGILLETTLNQTVRRVTGSDGKVQVRVQAGTVPTPVWVIARLPNAPNVSATQSNLLTIATGRPTQARFSLSSSASNINGLSADGVTSTLTIRAADRLGNPVPDGSVVNFVSEGASVDSRCVTAGGSCSVTFRSQRLRPVQIGDNPRSDTGRVTVTAYALGEESFVDQNGNNVWDAGEPFEDLGFVYIDPVETRPLETGASDSIGAWTSQRVQYIPFSGALPQNQACAASLLLPTPSPNGATVDAAPSVPGSCDGVWGTAHVRRDLVIVLSGDVAYLKTTQSDALSTPDIARAAVLGAASCSTTFNFFLQDANGNPMAEGTAMSADTSLATGLSAVITGSPVPRTTARGGTAGSLVVKGTVDSTTGKCTGVGSVLLNVDAPAPTQRKTTFSFAISSPP